MRIPMMLAAVLATACNPAGSVDGIWVIYLGTSGDGETTYTIEENYTYGDVPAEVDPEPSDWTYTYDSSQSDELMVARLVGGPKGEAFLFIADQVIPGTKSRGKWTFSWSSWQESTDDESHVTGYDFGVSERQESTSTMTFDASGGFAEGTISAESSFERTWTETDTWDPSEVGRYYSEIPADGWLEPNNGEAWVDNAPDALDCSGGECRLSVTSSATYSTPFEAKLTDFPDDDIYDAIQGVGTD